MNTNFLRGRAGRSLVRATVSSRSVPNCDQRVCLARCLDTRIQSLMQKYGGNEFGPYLVL